MQDTITLDMAYARISPSGNSFLTFSKEYGGLIAFCILS